MLNGIELTDQRRKVLELHRAGLSPREIAAALGLSTQRIYVQLRKLGVSPTRKDQESA